MSNIIFPTLHTSSWKMTRTPQWHTGVQTAVSGDRKRNPLQSKPLWKWTLKNGVLQSAYGDLQAIQNLYTSMSGRWDYFLWQDPEGASIEDPTVQINLDSAFYWPVAFTADALDFDRFAYQLWECGTVAFEQVMLGSAAFQGVQLPHGNIIGATLSILTSHIQGVATSIPAMCSIDGLSLFFRGWLGFGGDDSAWTSRTDTTSVPVTAVSGLTVMFATGTASPADLTIPDQFLIYDCSLAVSYADGTAATLRPTTAVENDTWTEGTLTNPGNAIDGSTATYALISRDHVDTLNFSRVLVLGNFQ